MVDPPAEGFLKSIQQVFQEAGDKGFLEQKSNQALLKSSIIRFLDACGKMTSARACAANPIQLPGGVEPATTIQRPPGKLSIDDKERMKLMSASVPTQFIKILRAITFSKIYTKAELRRMRAAEKAAKTAVRSFHDILTSCH